MFKRMAVVTLIGLCLTNIFTPQMAMASEDPFPAQGTAWRKLHRGFANVLLGGGEFLYRFSEPDEQQVTPPWFTGLFRGLYHMVKRTGAGIYEVVTFPFPIPQNYLPIIEPEFVWEYPEHVKPQPRELAA